MELPRHLLVILLVFLSGWFNPTNAFYKVDKYGLDQGLSQSSVYSILHDSKGAIWAGSADGLNRFDGISFKSYRFSSDQLLSGASNFITSKLIEDSLNRIWFGTENGIGYYNPINDVLTKVSLPLPFSANPCTIISISNGIVWFNNHWLLHGYNMSSGRLLTYRIPDVHVGYNFMKGFCADSKGTIWITTHKGLVYFNSNSLTFHRIVFPKAFHANVGGFLKLLCRDKSGTLYFQSYQGINSYNPKSKQIALLNSTLKEYAICGEIYDSSLIITQLNKGLFFINKHNGNELFYLRSKAYEPSLSNLIFTTLLVDKHHNLWVGLDGFGLNKINLNPDRFRLYQSTLTPGWDAKNSFTKSFLEQGDSLLFGTFDHGLFCLSKSKQIVFPVKLPEYLGKTISAIHPYGAGKWVVSGISDVIIYEPKTSKSMRAKFKFGKEVTVGNLQLFHTLPLKHGGIIASSYYGNFYWNGKLPFEFKKIDGFSNHTGAILEDKYQMVWVSSIVDGGVCRYKYNNQELKLYDKILQGYKIRWFWEDTQNNIIWMASAVGLIKYYVLTNTYELFNKQNGFPEDYLYAVIPDHKSKLWISTNNGLFNFNPTNGKIQSFQKSDGLQSNEFNTYSAYKLASGEIVFGGVNGFNIFDPTRLWKNQFKVNVALTEIKVMDELFNASLFQKQKLILPFSENTITFGFSALEMAEPQGVSTRYKLEGLDKEWVFEPQKRQIRYSGIPPGNYKFIVQAANRDSLWCPAQTLLDIVIRPPWWKLWWVIFIEFILGSWLLYFLLSYRYRLKIRHQALEIERVKLLHAERERISRDMHDDLGSGLTRISILSQLLSKPFEAEIKTQQIQKISETANELLDNMGNLVWTMNPGYDTIDSLLAYIRSFCSKLFDDDSIKLSIEFPLNSLELPLKPIIRKSVFLVVKEACNNCLKYSKAKELKIYYQYERGKHVLQISDDGIGFDPKATRQFGNGLLNMKKRMEMVGGSFTLESKPNEGTIITISF